MKLTQQIICKAMKYAEVVVTRRLETYFYNYCGYMISFVN